MGRSDRPIHQADIRERVCTYRGNHFGFCSSSLSVLLRRGESPEFDAGISGREPPVDPLGARVSTRGPGGHGVLPRRPVAKPLPQTLAGEHAQFEVGPVQPAPVFGGVADLQLVGQALGLGRGNGRIPRGGRMDVALIHDQHDPRGVGGMAIDELLDAVGEVARGPLVADRHVPPAAQGLGDQEQREHAAADLFRVVAGGATGCPGQRGTHLTGQLAAGLIEADDGMRRSTGSVGDVAHVLHVPDERGIGGRGEAPLLAQLRLALVFLSVWRTVSWEIAATTSRRPSASASRRNRQRVCPAGGVPPVRAIRCAAWVPSSARA